jgi:hypothetical protein
MTKHDDLIDIMAMSLRHSLEQMDLHQRVNAFYNYATVAVEALWATMWTIMLFLLLQLSGFKQANPRGSGDWVAFVFAGMVVVMLGCHGSAGPRPTTATGTGGSGPTPSPSRKPPKKPSAAP